MNRSDEILDEIDVSLDNINKAFDTIERYQKEHSENDRIRRAIDARLEDVLSSPDFQERIAEIVEKTLLYGLNIKVEGREDASGDTYGNVKVTLNDRLLTNCEFNLKGSEIRTLI